MKGQKGWDYRPYSRLTELHKRDNPYICRVEPGMDSCVIDWFDNGDPESAHSAAYRQRGVEDNTVTIKNPGTSVAIKNLKPNTEYEIWIYRENDSDKRSDRRRFRTGAYPGKVINYLHPSDGAYNFSGSYLCDPFILRTNTSRLLVSMSVYSNTKNQNLSMVFKSDDEGETWQYLCELMPCFWGKMFCHKNRIYMFAISNEYGHALLGYSEDDGEHWSQPSIIFPGASNYSREPGMHTSPGRVCRHKGRIWMGMEYGIWALGFHDSAVISVPEDADLMQGENWTMSELLRFDTEWEGARKDGKLNYMEGNVIVGPDGAMYNVMRNNNNDGRVMGNLGKAVILKIDADNPEKKQEFVANIDFNGGYAKFVIDRDEKTGVYYSIVNRATDPSSYGQRNIASLAISNDLRQWKIAKDLINASEESPDEVGFQYILHIPLGDDLLYVSRTACNHAHSYHDSNCITFHREKNFRELLIT